MKIAINDEAPFKIANKYEETVRNLLVTLELESEN